MSDDTIGKRIDAVLSGLETHFGLTGDPAAETHVILDRLEAIVHRAVVGLESDVALLKPEATMLYGRLRKLLHPAEGVAPAADASTLSAITEGMDRIAGRLDGMKDQARADVMRLEARITALEAHVTAPEPLGVLAGPADTGPFTNAEVGKVEPTPELIPAA